MTMTTGKAWTYISTQGGLIENLRLIDHKEPDTKPNHVLVEVLNASLNPGDYKTPDLPIVGRFIKRPASPCFDFCGRILALPSNLKNNSRNIHVGQVVWGTHRDLRSLGVLKTVMWVHKDSMYPLPEAIPVEHGSGMGVAPMTAYQSIAPWAKHNAKVLINGGSGGVGISAIQIAKALDMYVIATCSEAGAQLCKDLGADEILDYKSATFHDDLCRIQVDLVVDNVGYDPEFHRRSEKFLKPDGQFVLVALMDYDWVGIRSMLHSWLCPTWLGGVSRRWKYIFNQSMLSDYAAVAELAQEGKLKVVVDSVYPFQEVPEAFKKLKSGRAKGKIIVNVSARDL